MLVPVMFAGVAEPACAAAPTRTAKPRKQAKPPET